jgi:DNA-binding transcriptional LysR family regulator
VELVSQGLGVSLLPPAASRLGAGSVVGITTEPQIPRELMLVTPLDRRPSPAASALTSLLRGQLEG